MVANEDSAIIPPTAVALGIMVGMPPQPGRQVTLDNWLDEPFNRWSLSNTRRVFPTAKIATGGRPFELIYDLPPEILDDAKFTGADGTERRLDQWFSESYTDGILVLENGKNIYEDISTA